MRSTTESPEAAAHGTPITSPAGPSRRRVGERAACRAQRAGRRRTTRRSGRSAPAGRAPACPRAGAPCWRRSRPRRRRGRRAAERGEPPAQRHRQAVEAARDGVGDVALVAGEGLVAAVAVERDGDVAARQLGEVEARDRRGVGERLAVVAHDLRQDLDRVGAHEELLVDRCRSARRPRARAAARRSPRGRSRSRTCAPARRTPAPSPRRRPRSRCRRRGTRRAARRRSGAGAWPRAGRRGCARAISSTGASSLRL